MTLRALDTVYAGIDIGSTMVKAVAYNGVVVAYSIKPTGINPKKTGETALREVIEKSSEPEAIVATGYGRVSFNLADEVVSEITAHARGAASVFPTARTVIDVGGQDSKVIRIDGMGNVVDFAMNDKCAAGTGRFLENTAKVLDTSVYEFGLLGLSSRSTAKISSMCTVFAESEVISLLAQGVPVEDIAAGIHDSVARRIGAMADRVGLERDVVFTGGTAKNPGMVAALESRLNTKLFIPRDPQLIGAIGAAIIAREGL